MSWSDLPVWLLTSFIGAAIVKGLDLLASRHQHSRTLRQEKARQVLSLISQYAELAQLYRFHAYASAEAVKQEDGTFMKDEAGRVVMHKVLLEPDPRFEEAIRSLKGADVASAISKEIASIRLTIAEALDCAAELDPSGKLRKALDDLYATTIFSIEQVLKTKDLSAWGDSVNRMFGALKSADDSRRTARATLAKYLL